MRIEITGSGKRPPEKRRGCERNERPVEENEEDKKKAKRRKSRGIVSGRFFRVKEASSLPFENVM